MLRLLGGSAAMSMPVPENGALADDTIAFDAKAGGYGNYNQGDRASVPVTVLERRAHRRSRTKDRATTALRTLQRV